TALEESFRGFRSVDVTGFCDDVELVEFTWLQLIKALDGVQEPGNFGFFDDAFGKHAEFTDVLFSLKGTSAQRVGVCNRNVVSNYRAVLHGDLCRSIEGFFVKVQCVVAAGPLWVFNG